MISELSKCMGVNSSVMVPGRLWFQESNSVCFSQYRTLQYQKDFFRLTKICTLAPYCLYTLKVLQISERITQVWGVHTNSDTWVARGSERNSHSYREWTIGEGGIGYPMDMFLQKYPGVWAVHAHSDTGMVRGSQRNSLDVKQESVIQWTSSWKSQTNEFCCHFIQSIPV